MRVQPIGVDVGGVSGYEVKSCSGDSREWVGEDVGPTLCYNTGDTIGGEGARRDELSRWVVGGYGVWVREGV